MPTPTHPLLLKYRSRDPITRRLRHLTHPCDTIEDAYAFLQSNPTDHLAHIYTNTRPQRYITRLEANAPLSDKVRQKWPQNNLLTPPKP